MSWTIEEHGKGYVLYSGRDNMRHGMNLVYLSEPDSNWEKTKALIESAPDLLQALYECIGWFEDNNVDCVALDEAREAIAKARGQA